MIPHSQNNFSDKCLDALLAAKTLTPPPNLADAVIRSLENRKSTAKLDAMLDERLRHLPIAPDDQLTRRLYDGLFHHSPLKCILRWSIPAITIAATLAIVPMLVLHDHSLPAEEVVAQAASDDPALASMLCLQAAGAEALATLNHEEADIVGALNDNALAWLELETLTNYEI
ncbi:MAG: hypothetical protein LBD01_02390 [Puniceicoccales bacterium]|jgi:hypothetical protein|nr:hypothetical protein [Puniceicoccales bacterium]